MSLHQLNGDGILLCPVTAADADALQRHWNRRAVRRHLWDGQPVLSSHVTAVLSEHERDVHNRGVGLFTIRSTDAPERIVGCVGLRSVANAFASAMAGATDACAPRYGLPPELVVSVDHSRWRQGIATQAALMVLQDAHQRAGLRKVLAIVAPENTTVVRGLQRIGFTPRPEIIVLGAPIPAWQKTLP